MSTRGRVLQQNRAKAAARLRMKGWKLSEIASMLNVPKESVRGMILLGERLIE